MYMYIYPTLWDVTAHHRHVTLIYEVSQRHIPAGCSALPGVAGLFSCEVVDVDGRIGFLHHSNCIVGGTGT